MTLTTLQELGNICPVFVSSLLMGRCLLILLTDRSSDVYNKIDAISMEQLEKLARTDHSVVISCEMGLKSVGLRPHTTTSVLIFA